MAEGSNDLSTSFMDSFSCKICLEILHDPVQCQNNEHYFCRNCITKHLHDNTETCPLCADQLTLETLRPVPRVIFDLLSHMKKQRCSYVSRGCAENVKVEEQLFHEQTCGYAPVVCSNEGCKETMNRRDKESHETDCMFRMILCESCSEEMTYNDYEKHQCTLRKEINDMKLQLDEMGEAWKQVLLTQGKILKKLEDYDQSIKDLQNPLHYVSSATIQRSSTVINGQIFIFSGKSLEVFNWSTKTWTLVKDCLFFCGYNSFSFLYGKRIMVCNGDRIEYINPSESGFTSKVFPGSLPSTNVNGVLFGNRIISFGSHVQETSLERPWKSTVLIQGNENDTENNRSKCALERFGNDIFVIGLSGDKVERYNTVSNELTTLAPLPYKVYDMATVAYKDNIIILGGQNSSHPESTRQVNDVLMYNIHDLECTRLPSMLQKRRGCAAVIMGDVIVVMGGSKCEYNRGYFRTTCLNTVEYYVMGDSTWKELPAMNLICTVGFPTACVYK